MQGIRRAGKEAEPVPVAGEMPDSEMRAVGAWAGKQLPSPVALGWRLFLHLVMQFFTW